MIRQSQPSEAYAALMEIKFISAKDLPKMDVNGKADPFCTIVIGDQPRFTTTVIKKTRTPVWNESTKLLLHPPERNYNMEVQVWDWDKLTANDFIGSVVIDLSKYYDGQTHDEWHEITLTKKGKTKPRGSLRLEITMKEKDAVYKKFWEDIYRHFDTDGDGSLQLLELEGLLEGIDSELTDEEAKVIFDAADENKDGDISFEELWHLVTDASAKANPLVAKLLPADEKFIWKIVEKTSDGQNAGEVVMSYNAKWNAEITPEEEKKRKITNKIMVHDRTSGKLVEEKIPNSIKVAMRMMYSTGTGRFAVENNRIKAVLSSLTNKQGQKYNDPSSVKEIRPFIEFHQLNEEEMLEPVESFRTFNEFFFRKLKPDARPIAAPGDHAIAVSPADCRLHVFPTIDLAIQLWIKGRNFSLGSLLKDEDMAARYNGGSLVIARLAPQDYHRFHFPISGVVSEPRPIDGTYYTVNPIAINQSVDVYSENKRSVALVDSPDFGKVAFVAIGATMVGSICLTVEPGKAISKGDEYGYFAFGGSTVVLLFEPGKITFDEDLIHNSSKPLETLVRMGDPIGRANH